MRVNIKIMVLSTSHWIHIQASGDKISNYTNVEEQ